ncbi:hypothetical protein DLM_3175 [Aquitalea magnusonii]|uniref:DUF2946 family protein n=1 Tax=Aquitalea magnusonii TaxID=332411 RepID=A0A3G9GLA7_9NEIS|nr:DUF2946 family protein [Aquitalea magnusonii]BBF86772.1 hypothetical protein DLM_3175 [Aquitalea magnusonii]
MDSQVLAAMARWPNVPAVFGWLRLDARGQWWIREERLSHEGMVAFFNRNYSRDAQGRYYVQNGPQKVFVSLDAAPLVARFAEGRWQTLPCDDDVQARAAFMTEQGQLFIEIAGELAVVDDRDLADIAAAGLPGWDGDLARLPDTLQLPGHPLPLGRHTLAELWQRYGVVAHPHA